MRTAFFLLCVLLGLCAVEAQYGANAQAKDGACTGRSTASNCDEVFTGGCATQCGDAATVTLTTGGSEFTFGDVDGCDCGSFTTSSSAADCGADGDAVSCTWDVTLERNGDSCSISYVTAAGECDDVIDILEDNAAAANGPGASLLAIAAAAAVALIAVVA